MSKDRMFARRRVAERAGEHLNTSETALDEALHRLGLFCAELPKLRQEAQLSAIVGQDVFVALSRAHGSLTDARTHLVDAHQGFDRVRVDLDLPPVTATGGTDKPPPNTSVAPLRSVA